MATRDDNHMRNKPLQEHEIRHALLKRLSLASGSATTIQEEFRIERGGARIDVAVIGDGLAGYEIKSDMDSFARFANQIHAYNRVFDEVYLVCGPLHERVAQEVIPSWWGLLVAERGTDGQVQLDLVRDAARNTRQDPFSLASLLWKHEALAVLAAEMKQAPRGSSSHVLWECIAGSLPVDVLKSSVVKALLRRRNYSALAVNTI